MEVNCVELIAWIILIPSKNDDGWVRVSMVGLYEATERSDRTNMIKWSVREVPVEAGIGSTLVVACGESVVERKLSVKSLLKVRGGGNNIVLSRAAKLFRNQRPRKWDVSIHPQNAKH